jgi:hypothetical protein
METELAVFAGRRAWVTGNGPKAICADAVGWLRDRDVLLPGGVPAGQAGGAGTGRRDAAVVGEVVCGADRAAAVSAKIFWQPAAVSVSVCPSRFGC